MRLPLRARLVPATDLRLVLRLAVSIWQGGLPGSDNINLSDLGVVGEMQTARISLQGVQIAKRIRN